MAFIYLFVYYLGNNAVEIEKGEYKLTIKDKVLSYKKIYYKLIRWEVTDTMHLKNSSAEGDIKWTLCGKKFWTGRMQSGDGKDASVEQRLQRVRKET